MREKTKQKMNRKILYAHIAYTEYNSMTNKCQSGLSARLLI